MWYAYVGGPRHTPIRYITQLSLTSWHFGGAVCHIWTLVSYLKDHAVLYLINLTLHSLSSINMATENQQMDGWMKEWMNDSPNKKSTYMAALEHRFHLIRSLLCFSRSWNIITDALCLCNIYLCQRGYVYGSGLGVRIRVLLWIIIIIIIMFVERHAWSYSGSFSTTLYH